MVAKVRSAKLESRSSRLRLPIAKKPYAAKVMRGIFLLYRRNKTAGTWSVRDTRGGVDWIEKIGVADDHTAADGKDVLDFWQAQDFARVRAQVGKLTADLTVGARVKAYMSDLEQRGRDQNNAARVLSHLADMPRLANRSITSASLGDDLRAFREHLVSKGLKPATVNRIDRGFKAALTWAADHDERITRRPWKTALKALGGEEAARNVVLGDEDLRLARGQAYKDSEAFGLLFDVHYETGARSSQIVRLQAEDVQADFIDPHTGKRQPRLMMPTSKKGGSTKARTHTPVPITADLAQRLRGRTGVLLTTADGTPWSAVKLSRYFANAVEGVRFANPAKVTLYALRHGSITRQLLAGVPIRVVAAVHDTSVQMIERSYSAFIGDHSDDMVRKSLPQPAEVVPLGRHRA